MNAHLLAATTLAFLAVTVLSAGGGLASSSAASACTVSAALTAPPQAMAGGGPVLVAALLSEHGHCAMTVHGYEFTGLPGTSGPVFSTSGVQLVSVSSPGVYPMTVIIATNLGSATASATMQVA